MKGTLAAVVALCACATAPYRPPPASPMRQIADPTQRIAFRGFSILPPQGSGWLAGPPFPSRPGPVYMVAAFGKAPPQRSPWHTVIAAVLTWDVGDRVFATSEDFVQFERAQSDASVGMQVTSRHRVLTSRVAADERPGLRCVTYDMAVEDTGVPGHETVPYVLEMHGRRCIHPGWPRYVIDLEASERYARGEQPLGVENEMQPFLESLAFTDDRPLFVATIAVGSGPQGLVADAGGIWVAYGDEGVARIDARDNGVSKLRVGRDPVGITAAAGSIWCVNRKDASLSRIDPRTAAVVATLPAAASPLTIAAGLGSLWVAGQGRGEVVRVDPASGAAIAHIPVGPEPNGLLIDSGAVWVTLFHEAKLKQIDPASNRVVATVDLPRGAGLLAAGFGSLWVATQYDWTVTRIDRATHRVIAQIQLPLRPSGIAVARDAVWVTYYDEGSVASIDPRSNQLVGRPIAVGRSPAFMIFAEGAFWVSNAFSASVSRIDF